MGEIQFMDMVLQEVGEVVVLAPPLQILMSVG
jgi:hypothetical protein